jgi:hypothetical protein
VGWGRDE